MSAELCPDCGKPLKPRKAWGGLKACFCRFGGRKPSAPAIERALEEETLTPLDLAILVDREVKP